MRSVCDSPAGLISLDAAVARLVERLEPPAGDERLPIAAALGRVLATDLLAPMDLPPFTQSAMDGYAVRADEGQPGASLQLVGTALAGRPFDGRVGPGECVRVFTGACLPSGADAVVVQERVEHQGRTVTLRVSRPVCRQDNVRQQGEERAVGDRLLTAGQVLGPAEIGLLASVGCPEVTVRRRLRVAFLVTGDELIAPGQPLMPGCIYDSNRPVLAALLTDPCLEVTDLGRVADDREALRRALLDGAARADVLLTAGGASVGDADFVVDLLQEAGQVEFWKVAIKPGKPFVFGRLGQTPVFGLPGNPVSLMITFEHLAKPALQWLAGQPASRPLRWPAMCRTAIRKAPGRLEFMRGWLDWQDGGPAVTVLAEQGSHRLTSMTRANCYVVLPPDCAGVEAGSWVEVEPFGTAARRALP